MLKKLAYKNIKYNAGVQFEVNFTFLKTMKYRLLETKSNLFPIVLLLLLLLFACFLFSVTFVVVFVGVFYASFFMLLYLLGFPLRISTFWFSDPPF